MKKTLLSVFAVLFALTLTIPVFAEELVPTAPGVTASEMKAAVGGISKEIKNLRGSLNTSTRKLGKANGENRAAITTLATNTKDLVTETSKVATVANKASADVVIVGNQVHKTHEALLQVNSNLLKKAEGAEEQAYYYALILGILIVILAGFGLFIHRCSRRHATRQTRFVASHVTVRVGEVFTAIGKLHENVRQEIVGIRTDITTMKTAIDEVSSKTVAAMKKLEPITVTVNHNGRTAIVRPRIVNSPEGPYYLTTYVPQEGISEVQFPSEIARKRTNNFTKAYNDCKSTATKFLAGEYEKSTELHSQQQQALFMHLAGGADAEVQIIG